VISSAFAAEWRRGTAGGGDGGDVGDAKSSSTKLMLVGSTIVMLFGLGMTTTYQTSMWKNDETLWIGNLKADKTDWRAADQLVEHYIGIQSWEKARPHLDTIQMFSPQDGLKAELHKAKLLLMQGLTEDACMVYKDLSRGLESTSSSSFSTSPARGAIYNNNGVCSLHRNDMEGAQTWFRRGLVSTTHQRHRETLESNQQELVDVLKSRKGGGDGSSYRGSHKLIF
jgi:hypothetical protein